MKAAAMRPAGFDDWTPEEQMDFEEAHFTWPWCVAADAGPFGCPIHSLHYSELLAQSAARSTGHPAARAMRMAQALEANRREYEAFRGVFAP